MSAFTSYQGDRIQAIRDGKTIALLAGIAWANERGHLLFMEIYDPLQDPFDVVINDSITLSNLVIIAQRKPTTDVVYEFRSNKNEQLRSETNQLAPRETEHAD